MNLIEAHAPNPPGCGLWRRLAARSETGAGDGALTRRRGRLRYARLLADRQIGPTGFMDFNRF
jgi:hypothetical protein